MCIAFATNARRFCEAGSAKSLQVGVPQTCWVFALLTGAMYGTYEAFRYKVPGLHKVRYIGQVCAAAATGCEPVIPVAMHTLPSTAAGILDFRARHS